MSTHKVLSLTLLFGLLPPTTLSLPAPNDYSDKTVAEVLTLLEHKDPKVRECAAVSLGYRYRKPGVVVNPPTYSQQHPEFPLPPQLVPSLASHLKADPDYGVRIAAMRALRNLRSCTNTTPLLVVALDDETALVRIHSCGALIDACHEYSDPLPAAVIPTLRQSLKIDEDTEAAWIAAWTSGQLGAAGRPLLPALKQLSEHKSSKVRDYAAEAMKTIQRQSKGRK